MATYRLLSKHIGVFTAVFQGVLERAINPFVTPRHRSTPEDRVPLTCSCKTTTPNSVISEAEATAECPSLAPEVAAPMSSR